MTPGDLPLTASLAPLAHQVGRDLTHFALREQAFMDMVKAAVTDDENAWEEAKTRFHELGDEG